MDLLCPNCGGSASLPLEMTCRDHRPVPVPTQYDLSELGGKWSHPIQIRLAEDGRLFARPLGYSGMMSRAYYPDESEEEYELIHNDPETGGE